MKCILIQIPSEIISISLISDSGPSILQFCHFPQFTTLNFPKLYSLKSQENLGDSKGIRRFITPPTSFSQSRHSIDVTWRHTLSPRCTQRQKSVTGILWNAYYRLNKGWWRDKFVIRSVSNVLRAQSRLVKFVGGEAAGLRNRPYN